MRPLPRAMHPAQRAWLTWARWLARWHRYEVSGIEHLDSQEPTMILGYHGRYMAFDLIILNDEIYERTGRLPVSIMHTYTGHNPALRWLNEGLESVTGEGPGLEKAIADKRILVVLPGGNREANRSFLTRYRVDWGDRTGYLRLALRHNLRVIPVTSSGVDDTYIGLNNGYELGKRLELKNNLPAWLAIGPAGFVPFTPSFPVKFRQIIGPPIDLHLGGRVDPTSRDDILRLHRRIVRIMQEQLNKARETERAERALRRGKGFE